MNLISGGQGRDENDMSASGALVTVCGIAFVGYLLCMCLGCGTRFGPLMPGQVQDDFPQPGGDLLPAPARVRSQYLGGDKPRDCATQAETSKALKAADEWIKGRTFILHEKE